MSGSGQRVAAIVLTYNARPALQRCLVALGSQDHSVDAVFVTDNASTDPVDDIVAKFPRATLTRLPDNLGPAGGYAAALEAFAASDFDFAWVMDDDCTPAPGALAAQLDVARPDRVVLATVTWAEGSETIRGHGWWGALIPRAVVIDVGVPNAELFWWTEDTEYLQWRIPQHGYEVAWTEEAVGTVSRARADESKPGWKYYYEARNQVYHRLYVQRASGRPIPRHLKPRVRAWRATRAVVKLSVRSATKEHEQRARKLSMVALGTVDGLRGKLGRRFVPDVAHRPLGHGEALSSEASG